MLHRQHPQVHITGAWLGQLYRRLGIKRKQVVIKKFSNLKVQDEIDEQMAEAKRQLEECRRSGMTVYYADETMLTTNTYQKVEYSARNDNVTI